MNNACLVDTFLSSMTLLDLANNQEATSRILCHRCKCIGYCNLVNMNQSDWKLFLQPNYYTLTASLGWPRVKR